MSRFIGDGFNAIRRQNTAHQPVGADRDCPAHQRRGGCGSEVVLETVNASRAFLTTDSGFPLADLEQALSTIEAAKAEPNCLLVDYHLDRGNGIEAIVELRRRFGEDLPAILITADRSLQVRAEAQASGIHVLNKPVKPAALRALLGQMQMQRLAAAE